jgi:hypothetical protein
VTRVALVLMLQLAGVALVAFGLWLLAWPLLLVAGGAVLIVFPELRRR